MEQPDSQQSKKFGKHFFSVVFEPEEWRKGNDLPQEQGIIVGSTTSHGRINALVDTGDVHLLMIGAAGVGKRPISFTPT